MHYIILNVCFYYNNYLVVLAYLIVFNPLPIFYYNILNKYYPAQSITSVDELINMMLYTLNILFSLYEM